MRRYKTSVLWFSRYIAEITRMTDMMKRGEYVEKKRLVYAMSMAKRYKTHVIEDKRALGLDADLSAFSMEQKFAGFELKGGRLIKNAGAKESCVEDVTRKWIKGFPGKYDAFHFEIATLLQALDEPLTDDYYPADWRKEWREQRAVA